jgi:hypothetical protein
MDRARVAKSASEEAQIVRDHDQGPQIDEVLADPGDFVVKVGQTVMYQPPGDRRAVPCQITKIEDGQAYIVPIPLTDIGWVHLDGADQLLITQPLKQ